MGASVRMDYGSSQEVYMARPCEWSLDCGSVSKGVAGFKRPALGRMH